MTEVLLVAVVVALATVIVLQIIQLRRNVSIDLTPLQAALNGVEKSYERAEGVVRDELAKNRQEWGSSNKQSREELTKSLNTLGRSVLAFTQANDKRLDQMREMVEQRLRAIQDEDAKKLEQVRQDSLSSSKGLREEVGSSLKSFNESVVTNIGEMSKLLQTQLDVFSQRLDNLTQTNEQKLGTMRETIEYRLTSLQEDNSKKLDQMRLEAATSNKKASEEVTVSLKEFGTSIITTLAEMGGNQRTQLGNVVDQLDKLTDGVEKKLDAQRTSVDERLRQIQTDSATNSKQLRDEVNSSLKGFNDSVVNGLNGMSELQRRQLEAFSAQLGKLIESNEQKLDGVKVAVDERLRQIQTDSTTNSNQLREEVSNTLKGFNDSVVHGLNGMSELQRGQLEAFSVQLGKLIESNEQKLDAVKLAVEDKLKGIQDDNAKHLGLMRDTVDEKLQGTLERRLGESFTLVSTQLKQVHEGLGEMQALASNVGDLKRVMTNVKTRGSWGEVMLDNLLAQVLSPGQYSKNVTTKEGSGQIVDFAIKLPGRVEDGQDVVWVPIDSKFPKESFELLCLAHDQADPVAMEAAGKALEVTVKSFAKDICEKYLNPPKTTDFGIMFLPSEGLYAEVIRRVELVEQIQRECRIVIAGPSVLAALLNSLQMGFKTLQIQKTSSEIGKVLGAVKTEFGKFGGLLDGVKKKLDQASNNIDDVARKSRTIERRLRGVQELPAVEATKLLMLDLVTSEDAAADEA